LKLKKSKIGRAGGETFAAAPSPLAPG
jgi:hypothetical protein